MARLAAETEAEIEAFAKRGGHAWLLILLEEVRALRAERDRAAGQRDRLLKAVEDYPSMGMDLALLEVVDAVRAEAAGPQKVKIRYPARRCSRCGDKIKGTLGDAWCWKLGDAYYDESCCAADGTPLPREV